MDKRTKNEIGHRYGHLTVLVQAPTLYHKSRWQCRCDCGRITETSGNNLRVGYTRSCGCRRGGLNDSSAMRQARNLYRRNAQLRGLVFDISEEDFERITKLDCYYCGTHPSNVYKIARKGKITNTPYIYNGLDRIENTKGYSLDNVVPACIVCNRAKSDMPINEFIMWIKRLFQCAQNDKNLLYKD